MSKVEQYERIRVAKRNDPSMSVRGLARRFKVHRRDVRAALVSPIPPGGAEGSGRPLPVLEGQIDWIRQILIADRDVHPKQRHTSKRIRDRLAVERDVVVSESHMRHVVARLRKEIRDEYNDAPETVVTVAQTHVPGGEGEVDWGDFRAVIGGVEMVLKLFVMRLAFSGAGFHRAYSHEAQEAFLDGHVRAFEFFGGVPQRVRYDNLKTAVVKVLRGRDRLENERFALMRSHYLFDSFFCEPGVNGAHEKGGVEGQIGWFRRNYLVPVPTFDTLEDLNSYLAECDIASQQRQLIGRHGSPAAVTVAELLVEDRAALMGMAAEPFATSTRLKAKVNAKALICVRQCFYSVPSRLCGTVVTIDLFADHFNVTANGIIVASHTRAYTRRTETFVLDHYLDVLWKRPGGFAGSTALVQARATGKFTDIHQRFWDEARRAHGDRDGTRVMCEVLLLHRQHDHTAIHAGITAALGVGSTDPAVVGVECRRVAEHVIDPLNIVDPVAQRPTPTLVDYDRLLGRDHNGN